MLRQKHELHECQNLGDLFGAVFAIGLFIGIIILLAACVSTPQVAKEINDLSIAKTCTVFQPVTDTTSPQVRANNRARYSLCNTLEKTK